VSVQPVIRVDLPLDQLHAVLSLVAANVSARSQPWDDALEAAETTIDLALMDYERETEELERMETDAR
jgi:hypothetical protein